MGPHPSAPPRQPDREQQLSIALLQRKEILAHLLACRSWTGVLHCPQDRGVHNVHKAKYRPTPTAETRAGRRSRTRTSSESCPARRASSVVRCDPPAPAAGRCHTRGARLHTYTRTPRATLIHSTQIKCAGPTSAAIEHATLASTPSSSGHGAAPPWPPLGGGGSARDIEPQRKIAATCSTQLRTHGTTSESQHTAQPDR